MHEDGGNLHVHNICVITSRKDTATVFLLITAPLKIKYEFSGAQIERP